MKKRIASVCLALAALAPAVFAPAPAVAQGSEVVDVRVLPGWRAADGSHMAAFEFRLDPGWKTYWRAPGDAGIPPSFTWNRSSNLAGVNVIWPSPKVSEAGGVRTIGYSDVLILPFRVVPDHAGNIRVSGRMDIGVCSDICVPVEMDFSAELPSNVTRPDPRVAAAVAARPYTAKEAGVRHVTCSMSMVEGGLGLRAELDMPASGGEEVAMIEVADPAIWVAEPESRRQGNTLVAETKLMHMEGRSFALDRSSIRITVIGSNRTVDIKGCPAS